MERIELCTKNLIQAIQESEEYRQFCAIRDEVAKEPELRRQINEFRLLVFTVQNSREPLDMYKEQERLCRDYDEFRKNPLVNDFLQAELRVCRIVQKITMELAGSVDLDTKEYADRVPL